MSDDREIRRAFENLRDLEASAPPFRRVWLAARERQEARASGAPRRWLLRTAVALSAVVILVVVLVPASDPREPAPPFEIEEQVQALSEWGAPLDFLLESPESAMFAPEIWPANPDVSGLNDPSLKELL